MVNLSVIMPTIGRSTLKAAIGSVLPELTDKDELIVIADGPSTVARIACEKAGARYMEIDSPVKDLGATPRDKAIETAKGDYLVFVDDDDLMLQGAVNAIKVAIDPEEPPSLHIFGWAHNPKKIGPHGFKSGQQLVVPRIGCPKWKDFEVNFKNDQAFFAHCLELWPFVTHDYIIAGSSVYPGCGQLF